MQVTPSQTIGPFYWGTIVKAYRAALAKDPDDADALLGLGTAYARQGAVEKGLVALTKAAPHVNTGAAYNRLGVAQTIAGQFSEAQATFEKGLAVAPDDIASNRRMLAWGEGPQRRRAASALIGHDRDVNVLKKAIEVLRADGRRD